MRVILVTFSASYNFGASLQAYSLQRFVETLGHNVSILDIRKEVHRPVTYFKGMKGLLFNGIIFLNRKKLDEGNRAFENFSKQYFKLTEKRFSSIESLRDHVPDTDVFLTGSDQVFNPERCDPIFYLDFVQGDVGRVSYAASFGREIIPEQNEKRIAAFLQKFSSLSVREETGAQMIKRLTGQVAAVNIDPVFLTTKEEWRKLEREVNIGKEKYALCYCVYRPNNINRIIKEIKDVTGLKVIVIERSAHRFIANDKIFVEYGPNEFLWLIDHAEFVFTTSFHGLAFSIIFNKKVKPVENPSAPGRITNLLNMLGCKDRLSFTINDAWKQPGIMRDALIINEIRKSREYLAGAFENYEHT